jgi:hypothetical protein
MRCRLSPTAEVPAHTSGAAMGPGHVKTLERTTYSIAVGRIRLEHGLGQKLTSSSALLRHHRGGRTSCPRVDRELGVEGRAFDNTHFRWL